MGTNGCTGQLIGPFNAKQELFDLIKNNSIEDFSYISHIGIQMYNHTSPIPGEGTMVYINKDAYEIGKTGIYEIGNTKITSIYFSDDVDENTIIDYVIAKEE